MRIAAELGKLFGNRVRLRVVGARERGGAWEDRLETLASFGHGREFGLSERRERGPEQIQDGLAARAGGRAEFGDGNRPGGDVRRALNDLAGIDRFHRFGGGKAAVGDIGQSSHDFGLVGPERRLHDIGRSPDDLMVRHLSGVRDVRIEPREEAFAGKRAGTVHLRDLVVVAEDARYELHRIVETESAHLRLHAVRTERRDEVEHLVHERALFGRNLRHRGDAAVRVAAPDESRGGVGLHLENGARILRV